MLFLVVAAVACGRYVGSRPSGRAVRGVDIGGIGGGASTRVERWDDVPPFSAGYPEARKVIVSRIDALLRELEPPTRK